MFDNRTFYKKRQYQNNRDWWAPQPSAPPREDPSQPRIADPLTPGSASLLRREVPPSYAGNCPPIAPPCEVFSPYSPTGGRVSSGLRGLFLALKVKILTPPALLRYGIPREVCFDNY
jgi:hypothetical protein